MASPTWLTPQITRDEMMTLLTRMAMLALSATALLMIPGCDDTTDIDDEDLGDWTFRCDVLGGCGGGGDGMTTGEKGNTSFMGSINGEDAYALNNLSVTGDMEYGVQVTSIVADNCFDPAIGFVMGISEPNPTIPVSSNGELLPKTFTQVSNPALPCEVVGANWVDTYWTISYGGAVPLFETELWVKAMDTDASGDPRYSFWFEGQPVPGEPRGMQPLCDLAWEEAGVDYQAYLIPGLALDGEDRFVSDSSTVFMGCVSGSIGKALLWEYKPFVPEVGFTGHEVAHNAIRAEYCNDNVTYTETGTSVWFQSVFSDDGPDPNAPDNALWALEAVWSTDPLAPAICVGTTRLQGNQPQGSDPFPCPNAANIPRCSPSDLSDQNAVLATWAWTGA